MATIWPVVLNFNSNVEVSRSMVNGGYTHKTIPNYLELSFKASMLSDINITVNALPDPDFEIYHYPGIEVTMSSLSVGGSEGDADAGTPAVPATEITQTEIEEKELPPPPSGISFSMSGASEGMGDLVNVSGASISISGSDFRHLFPFERMEYKKDWVEHEITNFFPWDISPDMYDSISAIEPSSKGLWVGHMTANVSSSSSNNPSVKITIVIENDYNYWMTEYVDPMMKKSAKFVEDLEEDGEIDDGRSEPAPMEVPEPDYVELDESMFNEDVNGKRIGSSIDDSLRNNGDITSAIDSLISTTDEGDIQIPRMTTHKVDLLRKALGQLEQGNFREPRDIISTVRNYVQVDHDHLPMFRDIESALRSRSIGFVNELSRRIIKEAKISPNKIQLLNTFLDAVSDANYSNALNILNTITRNIERNYNYISELEIIDSKMEIGDTTTSIEYISELLDGDPAVFDNIPNPSVSNLPAEEVSPINPKRNSKEELQDWLNTYMKGK